MNENKFNHYNDYQNEIQDPSIPYHKSTIFQNQSLQRETNFNDQSNEQFQLIYPQNESHIPLQKNNQRDYQLIKLKNRINAKKSRENKKHEYQYSIKRMKQLQEENAYLKARNCFCQYCRKKIQRIEVKNKCQINKQRCEIEFIQPNFKKQDNKKNGKTAWIVVSVLMLLIGIMLHGPEKNTLQININKDESNYLHKKIQTKQDYIRFPLNLLEQKQNIKKKWKKQNEYDRGQQDQIEMMKEEFQEEQLQLNKFFIFQLQNQINDIGRYI